MSGKASSQNKSLDQLLTSSTIALQAQAANWEQAVRLAGKLLLLDGSITAEYIDAMVNAVKEIGPYMVIAPGIALAHARPEDGVLSVCMSLVRLADPVEFGAEKNDPVDLVFALGGSDNKEHISALKQLAEFLQDESLVASLRVCKTVREAQEIVKLSVTR